MSATWKRIVSVLAVLVLAALVALLSPAAPSPCPIAVKLVNLEPAGIYDDTDEMWAMSLSFRRTDPQGQSGGPPIYVEQCGKSEIKILDQWRPVDLAQAACVLNNFDIHDLQFAVPASTVRCRLNLKWARGRLLSGYFWAFAERLTMWPKGRLWLYKLAEGKFPRYGPGSHWQEFTVELPISPVRAASL